MAIDINKKGISLIVLAITIVIMVILAGAVVLTVVDSDTIPQTKIAVLKNNVSNYKDELREYISNQNITDQDFEQLEFSRDKNLIKECITGMSDTDVNRFLIMQGELVYIASDTLFTAEEITALKEIGIKPSEYTYETNIGVFSDSANYLGETIYVNPKPSTPSSAVSYILSYTTETIYSAVAYDPAEMGEIIAFVQNGAFYQYFPEGLEIARSEIEGVIFNGYTIEPTGSENITIEYSSWLKIEVDEEGNGESANSVLPENLPNIIGTGLVVGNPAITGIGNYASFEPYIPID